MRVVEDFQDWAEIFDEEYILCSWGCILHDMDYDWVDPHINLKRQYHDIKRIHRTRGLRYSVEKEGFEFTGIHHRAISVAENLAKLFGKYLDEWQF